MFDAHTPAPPAHSLSSILLWLRHRLRLRLRLDAYIADKPLILVSLSLGLADRPLILICAFYLYMVHPRFQFLSVLILCFLFCLLFYQAELRLGSTSLICDTTCSLVECATSREKVINTSISVMSMFLLHMNFTSNLIFFFKFQICIVAMLLLCMNCSMKCHHEQNDYFCCVMFLL